MTERQTRTLAADEAGLRAAASRLRDGGLVAFPTETVYGLGADARSGAAVAGIYAAKGRPRFNPLIAHVSTTADARAEGVFSPEASLLAQRFWPGPLTLVVPAAPDCTVCELARAGLPTVALRVPSHPVAHALLAATGHPVAAPSANRSGRISPTTAADVQAELDGRCDLILDGGPTQVGLESTIVSCLPEGVRLLRPGGTTRDGIERTLGRVIGTRDDGAVTAPGQLASHYAPVTALRLDAVAAGHGEASLDFAGQLAGSAEPYLDLSPGGTLEEAASNLFGYLRRLDAARASAIAVAPIPRFGLGEAINDRLARAATRD